jgi:uncharacterized protein YjbI with pentapeptide repeats
MTGSPDLSEEKLAQLRQALRNHLLFAAGKGGKRLNLMANNLSNFVLEGFNFSKASLLFCNLSYSNLQHARFRDADLTNSLFVRTNLAHADFSGAVLDGVKFHFTDARDAKLDSTSMRQGSLMIFPKGDGSGGAPVNQQARTVVQVTDLSNSNFEGASLQGAHMSNCILRNANLRNVDLTNANLKGADLQGANLQGACLKGANMVNVKVKDAVLDLTREVIDILRFNDDFVRHVDGVREIHNSLRDHEKWVNSHGAAGNRLDLAGRSLRGVDLTGKTLAAMSFAGADLSGAKLRRAVLSACDFTGATIQYADFTEADLRGANFTGATIVFTDFSGADFSPLALRGGGGLATRFTGATIRNSNLCGLGLTSCPDDAAICKDCAFNPGKV